MAHGAPAPSRYTSEQFFRLAETGVLEPDDRVELLKGVIVAMPPSNPRHAWTISRLTSLLSAAARGRGVVRVQLPFVAASDSVPEPDVAVVPGDDAAHQTAHPDAALLLVEVADASLPQDRLTKGAIYAAAGVPEYWIVNLRNDLVEVSRTPDRQAARYVEVRLARRGERLSIAALPGVEVLVDELLPARVPR